MCGISKPKNLQQSYLSEVIMSRIEWFKFVVDSKSPIFSARYRVLGKQHQLQPGSTRHIASIVSGKHFSSIFLPMVIEKEMEEV